MHTVNKGILNFAHKERTVAAEAQAEMDRMIADGDRIYVAQVQESDSRLTLEIILDPIDRCGSVNLSLCPARTIDVDNYRDIAAAATGMRVSEQTARDSLLGLLRFETALAKIG